MTTIYVTDRNGTAHELTAYEGTNLMEALRDEGMGVEAICGGQCACATCHCYIDDVWFGKLTGPSDDERELLASLDDDDPARSRLTCQVLVTAELDGLKLTVAPEDE